MGPDGDMVTVGVGTVEINLAQVQNKEHTPIKFSLTLQEAITGDLSISMQSMPILGSVLGLESIFSYTRVLK